MAGRVVGRSAEALCEELLVLLLQVMEVLQVVLLLLLRRRCRRRRRVQVLEGEGQQGIRAVEN